MRKRLRIAEPRVPRGRMIPRKKEPAGEVAGSFGGSEFFLGRSDEEREHNLQPELLDAGLNLRFDLDQALTGKMKCGLRRGCCRR